MTASRLRPWLGWQAAGLPQLEEPVGERLQFRAACCCRLYRQGHHGRLLTADGLLKDMPAGLAGAELASYCINAVHIVPVMIV